jgi:hypothetical protein
VAAVVRLVNQHPHACKEPGLARKRKAVQFAAVVQLELLRRPLHVRVQQVERCARRFSITHDAEHDAPPAASAPHHEVAWDQLPAGRLVLVAGGCGAAHVPLVSCVAAQLPADVAAAQLRWLPLAARRLTAPHTAPEEGLLGGPVVRRPCCAWLRA